MLGRKVFIVASLPLDLVLLIGAPKRGGATVNALARANHDGKSVKKKGTLMID
jgi:hypothetical protein